MDDELEKRDKKHDELRAGFPPSAKPADDAKAAAKPRRKAPAPKPTQASQAEN